MKKETTKELGKFILDLSKIFIAVAIITPFVKDGSIDLLPIFSALFIAITGIYITNKGVKDD